MQTILKVIQIGNSLGVILPKEVLAKLRVEKGDALFVTESVDGVTLRANDEAFAKQMTQAREIMKRRRQVLNVLAK
jgi:putative addiction module antidote